MLLLCAELVALVGGTVHSMVPGQEPRVATVLVRDGRIEAVGPELELPPGTERFDVAGLHVVPGLLDSMVYFDAQHDALYLAAGVTAVRDVGGGRVRMLEERRPENRDRTPGPTLTTCGAVLDGDPPSSTDAAILRDARAAQELLPILFGEQVDFLVVQLGLPRAAWEGVLATAHEAGLEVWGPVPRELSLAEVVAAGQDGLFYLDRLLPEGSTWTSVEEDELAQAVELLAQSRTPVVPLLQATALRLVDQSDSPLMSLLPLLDPSYEAWWLKELVARGRTADQIGVETGRKVLERQRGLIAALYAADVPLLPGSGALHPWLFPGQALHQELSQWVEAGIPAEAVLHAATRGAAEVLGLTDQQGSVAAGLRADLLCTSIDPRVDLTGLAQPELVVQRGRVFEREAIEDLLEAVAQRQQAAREALAAPLEVAGPPLPDGAPVLVGRVESASLGQRLTTESFAVVREPGDRIAFCGRVGYPGGAEMTVVQQLLDGRLEAFRIEVQSAGQTIVCEGSWAAESLRVRRTIDGAFVDNRTIRPRPLCLDVGSVTTLLALGQTEASESLPVLSFHELLEPELVRWALSLTPKGDHRVRTHTGQMAFRFDELGAPLLHRTKAGQSVVETRLIDADGLGGPGFPLPPSKRPLDAGAPEPGAEAVEAGAQEDGAQAPAPVGEGGER